MYKYAHRTPAGPHTIHHTPAPILRSISLLPKTAGTVITLCKMRLAVAYILGLVLVSVSAGPFTNPAAVRSC